MCIRDRIRTCQAPAQSEESCKTREETDTAESDGGGYGEEEEIVCDKSGLATHVAGPFFSLKKRKGCL